MHEDDARAGFGDGTEHGQIHGAGADIVDDVGARLKRRGGNGSVESVYADDERLEFGKRPDETDGREDTGEFF